MSHEMDKPLEYAGPTLNRLNEAYQGVRGLCERELSRLVSYAIRSNLSIDQKRTDSGYEVIGVANLVDEGGGISLKFFGRNTRTGSKKGRFSNEGIKVTMDKYVPLDSVNNLMEKLTEVFELFHRLSTEPYVVRDLL